MNYYTIDAVTEFLANKRINNIYTDVKVTNCEDLAPATIDGYYLTCTVNVKDANKKYKGKRIKTVLSSHWLDYYNVDFNSDSLTEYFDCVLGF
jgi:hypothetical protein